MQQNPRTTVSSGATRTGGALALRVDVVMERGEEGAWAFQHLPRFLPGHVQARPVDMKLIQTLADVSQGGWLHAEPETFWEVISRRRKQIHKTQLYYRAILENAGYHVLSDEITDASDEGQEHLIKEIHAHPPDLLVIACRHGGHVEEEKPARPVSGFVSHLASHVPCSTLILKRPPETPATERLKILFATDGTDASNAAARALPRLLPAHHLEATAVHIINPVYMENPVIAPYVNTVAVDEAMNNNAQMILTMAQGVLEAEGIPVRRAYSVLGVATWDLQVEIDKNNPDLVVVGSHQRHGLSAWMLGSVSQRVTNTDTHNVLIVR